jgi:hypothetical protein
MGSTSTLAAEVRARIFSDCVRWNVEGQRVVLLAEQQDASASTTTHGDLDSLVGEDEGGVGGGELGGHCSRGQKGAGSAFRPPERVVPLLVRVAPLHRLPIIHITPQRASSTPPVPSAAPARLPCSSAPFPPFHRASIHFFVSLALPAPLLRVVE